MTGEECARRRGQPEGQAVVLRQRGVQRRDMHQLLRRRGVPEVVDPDLAAVFERRDHVSSRRKEPVLNAVRRLVLLDVLYIIYGP